MSVQKDCMNCKYYRYGFVCIALPKVVKIEKRKDTVCSLFKPVVTENCQ